MTANPELLTREHRRLDELFGRFLAAATSGDGAGAQRAAREFDEELRRHTAFEEEHILEERARKLIPPGEESQVARRSRELRLEHVQIREVSGMIRVLLERDGDLTGALRLAPNLARRWDAHTTREERDLFPTLGSRPAP